MLTLPPASWWTTAHPQPRVLMLPLEILSSMHITNSPGMAAVCTCALPQPWWCRAAFSRCGHLSRAGFDSAVRNGQSEWTSNPAAEMWFSSTRPEPEAPSRTAERVWRFPWAGCHLALWILKALKAPFLLVTLELGSSRARASLEAGHNFVPPCTAQQGSEQKAGNTTK